MFHTVFERQARRSFELVNQHDYDSILASDPWPLACGRLCQVFTRLG